MFNSKSKRCCIKSAFFVNIHFMAEKVEKRKNVKNDEKSSKNTQKTRKNVKKIEKNQEKTNFENKNYEKLDFENNKFFEVFAKQNGLFTEVNRPLNDIMYANIIMIFAVFVSAFIPVVSLALPFLVFIYFEAGIYGFVYKVESDKPYKFEEIFVSLKKTIKIFCVFVIRMFLTIFFACLFLVPGVIVMLQYSFCPIILFESEKLDVRGVLALSKEMTQGYKWQIFLNKMIALATVCVAVTMMFLLILLFDVFLFVPPYFYIIFVTLAGVLDVILVALPLVEIAVADCYISSKNSKVANALQKTT